MGTKRNSLISKIWAGIDPLANVAAFAGRVDHQGWASDNPLLCRTIQRVRPSIVAEIGVWKGGSVLTMADEMARLGIDGAVIAIDTWLGAADHWYQSQWFADLQMRDGYPTLFRTFAANILDRGRGDIVLPLPLDSLNAATLLRHYEVLVDVVHVDGGHDYHSVLADLRTWWPMITPGGALIGDDYHPLGVEVWPEVRAAFHEFFQTSEIENIGGKCVISKALDGAAKLSSV